MSPQRSFVRVALLQAATTFVLPLTSLATAPMLARTLGADGRGEMAAVIAPVFVLIVVAHFGIPESSAYAVAKLGDDPRRVLRQATVVTVGYGTLTAVGLWLAAPAFLHQVPQVVPLLRGVAVTVPVLMWLGVARAVLLGMREYGAIAAERVVTSVLRLAAFAALLLAGELTVVTAVWAHVVTTAVGAVYLGVVLLRRSGGRPAEPPSRTGGPAEPQSTRALAWFGCRGWAAVIGGLVMMRLDQAVLVVLAPPEQVGYYVVAVSLAETIAMVVNSLRGVIATESVYRDGAVFLARASRILTALVVLATVAGCLIAQPFMQVLFGAEFAPSVALAQVLLVAGIASCLDQVVGAGVYTEGHPWRRSVSQLTAAAVTVTGLVVLVPEHQAMGAAVTSLLAYSTAATITLRQYRRLTGTPVRDLVLPRADDLREIRGWARTLLARRTGGPAGAAGQEQPAPPGPGTGPAPEELPRDQLPASATTELAGR